MFSYQCSNLYQVFFYRGTNISLASKAFRDPVSPSWNRQFLSLVPVPCRWRWLSEFLPFSSCHNMLLKYAVTRRERCAQNLRVRNASNPVIKKTVINFAFRFILSYFCIWWRVLDQTSLYTIILYVVIRIRGYFLSNKTIHPDKLSK